jgi:hypothetical protein
MSSFIVTAERKIYMLSRLLERELDDNQLVELTKMLPNVHELVQTGLAEEFLCIPLTHYSDYYFYVESAAQLRRIATL